MAKENNSPESGDAETPPAAKRASLADALKRRHAAADPSTSPEALQGMYDPEDSELVACLARNPSTPQELLGEIAANHEHPHREHLASNPNTPPDVLTEIFESAHSTSSEIARCVAANASTPTRVLVRLVFEKNHATAAAAAANPSMPQEGLDMLAYAQSAEVRAAVATNPAASAWLLKCLATEEERHRAASTRTLATIAAHPSTAPEDLCELAGDPSLAVRCAVAGNCHTPAGTLAALATEDRAPLVRLAAVTNLAAPGHAVAAAASSDPAPAVQAAALDACPAARRGVDI